MKRACNIKELLQKNGIDPTEGRALVLKMISESHKPTTPKQILETLRKRKPFDKVTLYRILDLFVEKRILRRFSNASGTMCYEVLCEKHNPIHPHFACRECGEMECLIDVDITDLKERILSQRKVSLFDIDLKLEGICHDCKGK